MKDNSLRDAILIALLVGIAIWSLITAHNVGRILEILEKASQ